jgi:hypothetical protein
MLLQEPMRQVAVLQQVDEVPSQDAPGGTHTRPRGTWLSHPQQPLLSQASPGQQCSPVAPQGLQVDVLVPVRAQTVLPKHAPAAQQGWPTPVVVSNFPQARQVPATHASSSIGSQAPLSQQGWFGPPQRAHCMVSSRHTVPEAEQLLPSQQVIPSPPQHAPEASHFPGAHWESRQHARHPRSSQSRRFPGQVHKLFLHSLPPLHTRSAFVPQ